MCMFHPFSGMNFLRLSCQAPCVVAWYDRPGYLWIPIYIYTYGYLWIPMDTYGNLWKPMETYGYLWIPMDTYGYLWIPMDTYGYLWIPMVTYGYLWLPMVTYGYLWLPYCLTHTSPRHGRLQVTSCWPAPSRAHIPRPPWMVQLAGALTMPFWWSWKPHPQEPQKSAVKTDESCGKWREGASCIMDDHGITIRNKKKQLLYTKPSRIWLFSCVHLRGMIMRD